MSSYFARLALRAVGRPVGARLMPRLDSQTTFEHDARNSDAIGGELPIEAPLSPTDERDARDRAATAAEPVAASVRRAPIPEAVPAEHARSALVADPRPLSAHARSLLTAAAVDTPPGASPVGHALHASRTASPRSAPRDAAPSAARARSGSLAGRASRADRAARSSAADESVARARDGTARDLDTAELGSGDRAAATRAPAMLERRDSINAPASPGSSTPSEALAEAKAVMEPASISVEIGRIEVKVAPAPASRPRAAPEGFDGYWRLRNYLDRPR